MNILAIDTAQWISSVALWKDGEEIAFQESPPEQDQAALLPFLVEAVLGNHPLDLLLINTGPGSFTGIRVGLAFAKGFSCGSAIPLKGIDGFTAAYTSLDTKDSVLVLIESKRQEIFGQLFQGDTSHPPQNFSRKALEDLFREPFPSWVTGSGFEPFLTGLKYKKLASPWQGARALAYTFFKNPTLVQEPTPLYVRQASATLSTNLG